MRPATTGETPARLRLLRCRTTMNEHLPARAGCRSRLPRVGCPDMNQNTAASPATTAAPQSPPVRQPLDPRAVAVALAGIRTDSQREPDTYLRDTVVPYGGE